MLESARQRQRRDAGARGSVWRAGGEAAKPADLVILSSHSLHHIRHSSDFLYVMTNDELYDGATLHRGWPSARPFPTPPSVRERQALEALGR